MKVKVGNLDLEIVGEIELNGKTYKIVEVPSADDFKGFPPSWETIKNSMLSWRPYFKGKMLDVDGKLIPIVNDEYVLYLDEEMYELLLDLYYTFKVNKPPIEVNVSTVVTRQIENYEAKINRNLDPEEKTHLYLRYSIELAILKDLGMIS
ncbi:hypothetical protein [Sulfurisphaera tokodaii]|uniref:Uncharacterized protein n=2 Tax=Sulfurisphaera tokodaii TaxID=111955 RepID=Q96ZD3_SULTO|nr:hypothetical protein [Sulfurisphaera tokodaii]BAB66992.1 hypothetical protein STK_18980 [Sulfurisphaera tokodaii str. 7]HII75354.1 hypothetical protein [Sulfurisphaera tokodaii]